MGTFALRDNLVQVISCLSFINIVNGVSRLISIHFCINKIIRRLKFFVNIFIIIQWITFPCHHIKGDFPGGRAQENQRQYNRKGDLK